MPKKPLPAKALKLPPRTPRAEPPLVDLKEIPADGDAWEAFARDFLVALGFAIDAPPNRGPDGGKDLIVSETLKGKLSRYPLRWMVSCKHKVHSGKAVSETEESNLLERLRSVKCDAFIGVYSTVPTSGLAERLRNLRDNGDIRDYRILDGRLIDNHLVRLGFSTLVLRYFPSSYKRLKPIHALTGKYRPLLCATCGRDMLEAKGVVHYRGLVAVARKPRKVGKPEQIVDVYWAHKGTCDRSMEAFHHKQGLAVGWEDISDIAIPVWYLQWLLGTMNGIREGTVHYTDAAYEKLKTFLIAMAQRVFREMTEEERRRFAELLDMPTL